MGGACACGLGRAGVVAGLFGVLIGIPALRLTTRGGCEVLSQRYV